MSVGKSQGPLAIGMNYISITTNTPSTFEETYNELMQYINLPEPLLLQFEIHMKKPLEEEKITTMLIYKENNLANYKQIEEVKMISDVREPSVDLDKCSLHDLLAILEKFSQDPTINVHQAGFGSYIANYVIKEKIERYNNEALIPPMIGYVWIPKILISIQRDTPCYFRSRI
jgi:hypothetical protein